MSETATLAYNFVALQKVCFSWIYRNMCRALRVVHYP